MRRAALILTFLMVVGFMFPTAPAYVDDNTPLAVYINYDNDLEYDIGSSVKMNILVYWEGDFYDQVTVTFSVAGRAITPVRRDEGKYEANFQIEQNDLDGSSAIACWANAYDGTYPAPYAADSVHLIIKSLDMDIVVLDYGDSFMSPGDECEFEVRTSYDGRLVDPDAGTLFVYRQVRGSAFESELTMVRVSTGVFAGILTTSSFNRTYIWTIGCRAEYTTPQGVVYGYNTDVVQVEMFPLWIKQAMISTTASVLEFHVWEKNGWPQPDSVEGYPLQGAYVELTYSYRDDTLAYQEKQASGTTGPDGSVSLNLDYPDMRTGDWSFLVTGQARVGTGISAHYQSLEFLLPVRDYDYIPDMVGFDVQLHNYYIPEWTTLTTLGHTARFDGQPLVGQEIFVYIAVDDWIYHAGPVLTGPQGYFNVQIKTPPLPEGERWLRIDKCEYSADIGGQVYSTFNSLHFGEANLYGEFNQTHDEGVTLSVSNLKEHQVVHVTIDHPDADGEDEKAIVMWGLGDPWDYWSNQQWLYDLLWARVRPHRNMWPSTYQHINYVPAFYKEGAWHAFFY